ncbi:MAG: fasciclin domain-containing protein [Chloroflexi bacterium]|nr:fasciclin domain-containing protein [Chloroflexota bacterium]
MKYLHRLILAALLVIVPVTMVAGQDDQTIAGTLAALADADDAEFTLLLQALEKTDLLDTLDGNSPMTLFAPTDDAFRMLFDELGLSQKQVMAGGDALKEILLYHVVDGEWSPDDLWTRAKCPACWRARR